MNAFVRIETLDDLTDLITLLRRGAAVGIEAVPGGLFGPTSPCKFNQSVPTKRRNYGVIDLEGFLFAYLDDRGIFKAISVEGPDTDVIKRVWRVLNHAAATTLTATQIIDLCRILGDHYGGTIEPQIAYRSPGWIEGVKAGYTLVCWTRPSLAELTDFQKYGAAGVVNATAQKPWFAGVSGPYMLPNRGLVRYEPGMAPVAAWERSGEPTGISATWDRVAAFYRLCGIVVEPEADDEALKAPGWEAMQHATKRGARPQDIPVRPVPVGTAEWLNENWDSVVRVSFVRS